MAIYVIGSLSEDTILRVQDFPAINEEAFCIDRMECHGGGGANVAVFIHSFFGMETRLISCLGADRAGENLLAKLHDAGVNTVLVKRIEGKPSTRHIILVDHHGNRMTCVHSGAMEAFSPTVLELGLPEQGQPLIISPLRPDSVLDVFRVLRRLDLTVFWNPGASLVEIRDRFFDLLPQVHCLILNKEESLRYCVCEDVFLAAERLLKSGIEILAITLGHEGALAFQGESYFYTPALDVPEILSVGCGDAFFAGFAGALIMGNGLEEAVVLGNALGAFMAAQPSMMEVLPSKEQLQAIRSKGMTKPIKAYLETPLFSRMLIEKDKGRHC